MKRLDLIRRIEEDGTVFVRHGSNYDWYRNVITGVLWREVSDTPRQMARAT